MQKNIIISILLIILLGFAAYANSLPNKFVWDDHILIENNVYIHSWKDMPRFFSEDIASGGQEKFNSYRPLQMVTYSADYFFWKLLVGGYHLTNIFLHIAAALCIFWLIRILYADVLIAFLTAALFCLHPVQTEAVVYISGRADSLAVVFMLLCFIFYLKYHKKNSWLTYFLTVISYSLALLSRENSLILPFLLLFYHYCFKVRVKTEIFAPLSGLFALYAVLRLTLLKSFIPAIVYSGTLFERIPGVFAAIANYIRILFLPFGLHMEYGQKFFPVSHPSVLLGLGFVIVMFLFLVRYAKTRGILFFSLGWFLITLIPSLNIYPLNAYMAEHWLYFPSLGFFLAAAFLLVNFYRKERWHRLGLVICFALPLFYLWLTVKQNTYWKEPLKLYERTLRYSPDSVRTYHSLAGVYSSMGRKEEALRLLKKALALNPAHSYGYNNIGNIYASLGRFDEAIAAYGRAIQIDPAYAGSYNNLGNIYCDIGRKDEALAAYEKAVALNPNLFQAYNNLGNIYNEAGNKEKALACYQRAVELNPNLAEIHSNIGCVYRELGRNEEAIHSFRKAIELNPGFAFAYNNLGLIYAGSGKHAQAAALYRKALAIDPRYASVYYNLGLELQFLGKQAEASRCFGEAFKLNPSFKQLYEKDHPSGQGLPTREMPPQAGKN